MPQAFLMDQMFNILLPRRSKWLTLILLNSPVAFRALILAGWPWPQGRVSHGHRWARSAASSNGHNSTALCSCWSRLACWSWRQSHCLQLTLIYAQDMCILRRKDLGSNCKDYSIVGALVVHSIQDSLFQVWQWNKYPDPTEDTTD